MPPIYAIFACFATLRLSYQKGSGGAVRGLISFYSQIDCAPSKEANIKLHFALVAVILAGTPVGAWADDYPPPPSCNLSSSLINHIQAQLQAVVNLPDANGGIFKLIVCGQR
jgi:hypothetical protein